LDYNKTPASQLFLIIVKNRICQQFSNYRE